MKIYCDGSGWNGRESRWCVQMWRQKPHIERYDYERTNNEMEYAAVLWALNKAVDGDIILTDSQLAVSYPAIENGFCVSPRPYIVRSTLTKSKSKPLVRDTAIKHFCYFDLS